MVSAAVGEQHRSQGGLAPSLLCCGGRGGLRRALRPRDRRGRLGEAEWALLGCFASGDTLDELREALEESISLYVMDDPGDGRIKDMGRLASAQSG